MSNNHLILGLGGTGGKVIREIRKLLISSGHLNYEQGDTKFEFLYVDTSTDELDKTEDWMVLGIDSMLERSQYLINKSGDIRPVLNDPASYPGLTKWINPTTVFDFVTANTAGAAQKRKLGRVVFAQNAPSFIRALDIRMKNLQTQGNASATIHVICGLAGGTGSGTVVDAVAQIRNRYPDSSQYKILIYALIPEKHPKEGRVKNLSGFSNYFANGYAALRELNALGAGKYHPTDILDGKKMEHGIYFNGCYLLNDINENNKSFDIEKDVPKILSEFIYQKCINISWDGLSRAEKGENDTRNFEIENGQKERAKLFLSFGIKRVIVPEEEIKEFMTFDFAEQVTRQLMYNNFREGDGYADEEIYKDWASEARKPEVRQPYLLTDQHLGLEVGILEDDKKITTWKPLKDYWTQATDSHKNNILQDKNIERTQWLSVLNMRLSKMFDETYRTLGVKKFYEVKSKAKIEIAATIARTIELDFFARWKSGDFSLSQTRSFLDAIISELEERQENLNEKIQKAGEQIREAHAKIEECNRQFNEVGWLGQKLTDKSEAIFSKATEFYQKLFYLRSMQESQRFAVGLLPHVREKLTDLRTHVDRIQQQLTESTKRFVLDKGVRLDENKDASYQKRLFDTSAIHRILKAIKIDEQGQKARTQSVRKSLIDLGGVDVNSFEKLGKTLTLGSVVSTLSKESSEIILKTHQEIAKDYDPVLNVNIVGRLMKQYDANSNGLKTFVQSLYDEAGCMITFDQSEVDRVVTDNAAGSQGRSQTIGVFIPEFPENSEFHAQLRGIFKQQQDVGTDAQIIKGLLSNQITILKVSSLMPARFIKDLKELKRHYDGLLQDKSEVILLHSEGDGSGLPNLYAKTAVQRDSEAKVKPTLLLAKLLNLVKERVNATTGLKEWIVSYKAGGLPTSKVLEGSGSFHSLLQVEQRSELQDLIAKEVQKKLDADYVHLLKKKDLLELFSGYAVEIFEAKGENDQDPEYTLIAGMRLPICKIVGIPESELDD